MGSLGKRLVGIVIGVILFIGIEEVRSRFGSSETSHEEKVTQADADLYLQVMRVAADRVNNPTPEDLRVMDDFSRIKNVRTASANELSDSDKQTIWKALELTSNLDKTVAHDMQVDENRYERVRDRVNSVLAPEDDHAEVIPQLTSAEKKALAAKGEALGSSAQEIKQLYATVYNNPFKKTVNGN